MNHDWIYILWITMMPITLVRVNLNRNEILIYFSISIHYPHLIIYFSRLQGMKSFSSLVQIDRFNSRRARANTSANFFRVQMRFH